MDWSVAILVWIACGIASLLIAQSRGATNAITWFAVGVLLGPIGVILAVIGARGPGRSSGPANVADELAKLVALRNAGELTTAEFDQQRNRLLGSAGSASQNPTSWQQPAAPSGSTPVSAPALAPSVAGRSHTAERVVVALIILALLGGGVLIYSRLQVDRILADVASALPTVRPATALPVTPPPANDLTASIGEAVDLVGNDGNALGSVTVIRSGKPSELLGSRPTPGTRYIAALVNYVARSSWTYTLYDWAAHDARQFQYEPLGYAPNPSLSGGTLSPGRQTEGWVAFEVPEAVREVWLDLQTSDGEVIVSIQID